MEAKAVERLAILVILLLVASALPGVLSLGFSARHEVVNQYGDVVELYGSGIYAADTYFKAPILIGTDAAILLLVVPLFAWTAWKRRTDGSIESRLRMIGMFAVAAYYAASVALGVKYNQLHLLYIALFGCAVFGLAAAWQDRKGPDVRFRPGKGLQSFLVLCGVALVVAWLPDIVPTLLSGEPLHYIGVYTTEITYVLDMGLIAPLCFVALWLLRREEPDGVALLAAILRLCLVVGCMMIPQTFFQYLSGVDIPLPALLTKTATFVLLGATAFRFERILYQRLKV